jgi:hypothetical protein
MDKEEEGNGRGGKIKREREREGYILWSFMLLVYRKEPFCQTYHKKSSSFTDRATLGAKDKAISLVKWSYAKRDLSCKQRCNCALNLIQPPDEKGSSN